MGDNKRFGWHSGTIHCKDAKVLGDLYIQDDIIFSDVSAGKLSITGGIDLSSTTSAIGIDLGGIYASYAINIDGTVSGRAIAIGTKTTGLPITATAFEAEPGNNYHLGLFSAVASTAADLKDELRSAWIRTRVNDGCHIGNTSGPYGFGVCGAELQLKFYATSAATNTYGWQNSAVWAQLETQGASGINFKSGSHSQCVLANVGLTSTTTIDSGANVAGVTINTNTATSNVTATGGFYGLFVTDIGPAAHLDFKSGIFIDDDVATTGITIGNCTTGMLFDGTFTTGINMVGGVSYNPIHIGVKDNVANKGIILTGVTDDTGGVMIFADDGGASLGSVTSPIWTRYMITEDQSAGATFTGAFAQTKSADGLTFTDSVTSALKAYYQVGGDLTLVTSELAVISAGITYEGTFTNTSGTLSGVDINVNDHGETVGTASGLLIRKTSGSTAGWTYGINIADAGAVTGVSIGSCTNAIVASAVGTGTDGWLLKAGTAGTPLVSATAGGAIVIYNNLSAASGSSRTIWAETALTTTGGSLSTSFYTIRGHAKLGASVEVDGAAYIAGVQGKFTLNGGTINHADSRYAAVFAQLDLSSGTYTTGQVSGLWVDATLGGTMSGAQLNLLRLTCSTPAVETINSVIFVHSEADYLMELSAPEGNADWFDEGTQEGEDCIGHLKVYLNGNAGYVNVFSDNS